MRKCKTVNRRGFSTLRTRGHPITWIHKYNSMLRCVDKEEQTAHRLFVKKKKCEKLIKIR